MNEENFKSILMGQMAGDSIGLPYEFLNKEKTQKRFKRYGVNQSFFCKKGIVSDDTEHLVLTSLALIQSQNSDEFGNKLKHNLKYWFLTLPPGIGMTTLKSCFKMLMGFSYNKTGVISLGNGPAMRCAIIAAFFHQTQDREKMLEYLKVSTFITHNHQGALDACISMSNLITYLLNNKDTDKPWPGDDTCEKILLQDIKTTQWIEIIQKMVNLLKESKNKLESDTKRFFEVMQLDSAKGISGYIMHSMAWCLWCALAFKNVDKCFKETLLAGGDTDSTCAVIGAILGCVNSPNQFNKYTSSIIDYPININLINKLSLALEEKYKNYYQHIKTIKYNYLAAMIRNIVATGFILCHAVSRFRPKSWY